MSIPGDGNFKTGDINVTMCTHLVYAFAVLDPNTYTMVSHDTWLDINLGNFAEFVKLKQSNPDLKTMVAIGGWTDSQNKAYAYKAMFNSQALIDKFAR